MDLDGSVLQFHKRSLWKSPVSWVCLIWCRHSFHVSSQQQHGCKHEAGAHHPGVTGKRSDQTWCGNNCRWIKMRRVAWWITYLPFTLQKCPLRVWSASMHVCDNDELMKSSHLATGNQHSGIYLIQSLLSVTSVHSFLNLAFRLGMVSPVFSQFHEWPLLRLISQSRTDRNHMVRVTWPIRGWSVNA